MTDTLHKTGKPVRSPWLRRGRLENIAVGLIGLGFLIMFQPFALSLYTYSFVTLLAGTAMFIIVSKFPE
jgi:hypothetical protein